MLETWEGTPLAQLSELWGLEGLEAWESLGSTADRLREWSASGARPWSAVLAETQTAGRGRSGKQWVSSPGQGVWISVLTPPAPYGHPPSLLAGVAVVRALSAVRPGLDLSLKWPNDVWLQGAKVAGILCEGAPDGPLRLGLGVNVLQRRGDFPSELRGEATSLAAVDPTIARREVVGPLLAALRSVWTEKGRGWLEEWRSLDALRGRWVETDSDLQGRADGIEADGRLRIVTQEGALAWIGSGSVRCSGPIARYPSTA